MTWVFKISKDLLNRIRQDVLRPHEFAAERVGFLFARIGNQTGVEQVVLPERYEPVPDDQYLNNPKVGACIGSSAIRAAMQMALSHGYSVFHVHMHEHKGQPRFSRVDLTGYPGLIQSFRNVAPERVHGALLLSEDSCDALVWLAGARQPVAGGRIVVLGRPMDFFDAGALYG